ncbi:WYL domain-containing protein [Paenibacillus sp. alder61]|uniref:WYL domain-containing protein n=1 Tax=Paenibacillus sp. alder61 TaxID=2862948 RepID=UPI001CD285E4|nr:WYL domain-containing protein [Paenibacillus sp. alder61]MCA1292132.1 WYL domain-containing protein [Paenibacillus sp. alder61]
MNPFEKIFNYQVISRLDDSGTFMVTAHERAWLKKMLKHPAAEEAFTPETRQKLQGLLQSVEELTTSDYLTEKAKSAEKQVYHPLLRILRRHIVERSGIRISFQVKRGRVQPDRSGLAYKLEYSMVKREWYLLWYDLRRHALMSTRLSKLISIAPEPLDPAAADQVYEEIARTLDSRKTETVLEVVREYHKELSRILYAFSCFEKTVEYDEEQGTYRLRVCVLGDEVEYLLSKIRFLGKRVRILEGDYLKRRMLEASTKALERYGDEVSPNADEVELSS